MALLNDEIRSDVVAMMSELPNSVTLTLFTDDEECEYCPQIVQLLEEVSDTSDKVNLEIFEINKNADQAEALNITKAPAIAILGEGDKDYGMRFFGIPSGYEFSTLLNSIQRASLGSSDLDSSTKSFLSDLSKPVNLQVFVTPTCPYCPRAAVLAMNMAVESDLVNADVVESTEFAELANQYNVMGVPLSVINGTERVEGAAPPQQIVEAIRKSLG
jgi:glutaredoxin-like protein